MSVNLKSIFQRNSDHPWQSIGDNTVILSTKGMMSHELESTGSFIWQALDGQKNLLDISDLISDEYDVSPEGAQDDLVELIDHLLTEDLVQCLS